METLAFIHTAVDYEDPNPAPELRSLDEITSAIPSSALLSVAGAAIAVGVLTHSPDAQAAVRRPNACSAVSAVQSSLQASGYSVGGVDGVFGNKTEFAVKQFQARNGLAQDGVVGPATAGALGLNRNISCATSGSPGSPGSGLARSVRVTAASGLNIRSGPSLNSSVLGTLGNGAVVRVTGRAENGFLNVGRGGWIAAAYTTSSSGDGGDGGGGGGSGSSTARVVAGIGVKYRSGPGLGYGQIGGADYGQTVSVTGERVSRDGYTWAKLSGQPGWVATGGLNIN